MRLAGKTALVTGSSRGIGREIALAFAREGADVAVHYRRRAEAAHQVADEIRGLGRRSAAYAADVAEPSEVEALIERAAAELGGFDILVANSGMASRAAPVARTDPGYWRRVIDVDLSGAFYTCRFGVPHLRDAGSVLLISSVGADLCAPFGAPYHVAKAGVNALTKVLARELAPEGKRSNCIAPGLIATEMGERLVEATGRAVVDAIPLGRMGRASDVAAAAVYLASEEASFVTGKILRVDGGTFI